VNPNSRKKFGVSDCDAIRCPKLDPVLFNLAEGHHKAHGYLLRLQQFSMGAVAPLASHNTWRKRGTKKCYLKTMAEEVKGFQKAAPLLFGEELAK
jgi:hypothetical protein